MASNNPAMRRIRADVKELEKHSSSRYSATPLEENMFEWHFTIRGPSGTEFEGGMYHGKILLPPQYPFKPPHIVFFTKNGRFDIGVKICLSISAYHEETWQPAWGIRTMLEALISFLPTEGAGAIGALDWSKEERKKLAIESKSYCCPLCGDICQLLSEPTEEELQQEKTSSVDPEIAKQIAQLKLSASEATSNPATPAKSSNESPAISTEIQSTTQTLESTIETSVKSSIPDNILTDEAVEEAVVEEGDVIDDTTPVSAADLQPRNVSHITAAGNFPFETPPSLKIVRKRILHNRHGVGYVGSAEGTVQSQSTTGTTVPLTVQQQPVAAQQVPQRPRVNSQSNIIDYLLMLLLAFCGCIIAIILLRKALRYVDMHEL